MCNLAQFLFMSWKNLFYVVSTRFYRYCNSRLFRLPHNKSTSIATQHNVVVVSNLIAHLVPFVCKHFYFFPLVRIYVLAILPFMRRLSLNAMSLCCFPFRPVFSSRNCFLNSSVFIERKELGMQCRASLSSRHVVVHAHTYTQGRNHLAKQYFGYTLENCSFLFKITAASQWVVWYRMMLSSTFHSWKSEWTYRLLNNSNNNIQKLRVIPSHSQAWPNHSN